MDITFRFLDAKFLVRALTIAQDQHQRALDKAVKHFGEDSATAKELQGFVANLRNEINNINNPPLPFAPPRKEK